MLSFITRRRNKKKKKNCGNEVAKNWRSHSTHSYSYSPKTFKYIEYILYSFPIKPTDITHIEFMSCIDSFFFFLFLLLVIKDSINFCISSQKVSTFFVLFHLLLIVHYFITLMLSPVCTTKDCKFWVNVSFCFALLTYSFRN